MRYTVSTMDTVSKRGMSIVAMPQRVNSLLAVAMLTILFTASSHAAQIVDQQQLRYDGGTAVRTLDGYSVWQSFSPSMSGTLTQIDVGFFNDISGVGTLEIRAGDGSSGPILQSVIVPVFGTTRPAVTWNAWSVSVPIQAGVVYTFRFTADPKTVADPYSAAIGASDPYNGGVMGLDDPSGSYRTEFDLVFRTYVTVTTAESIPTVSERQLIATALLLAALALIRLRSS